MEILQVVSHGDWNTVINQYKGLEISQLGDVLDSSLHRVLKWVNLGPKTWGSWRESKLGAKHKGLERSQFVTFGCISHCDGLERSQFRCKTQGSWKESICDVSPYMSLYRVLKGVNFDVIHKGLERSQFLMVCWNSHCWGSWKESILMRCHETLFKLFHKLLYRVLKEVQCLMLKVWMTFCWPISLLLVQCKGWSLLKWGC